MICSKCGRRVEDNSVMCHYCGQVVSTYTSKNTLSNNERGKYFGGALATFLFIVSLIWMTLTFLINIVSELTVGRIVCFAIGVLLCAISRYLKYSNKNTKKYWHDKTAQSIMKRIRHENNETVRLVARKVPIKRIVLTICFSLVLFFALDLLYDQYMLIPVLAIILLLYETLFLKIDTFSILYKKAKKFSDLPVDELVSEETYNEVDYPQLAKSTCICVAVVLMAIGSFIYLNQKPSFDVKDVKGGVCITHYEPGILHLKEAVQIPREINGKTVLAIGEEAFAWNVYMTSVSMPDTVKIIGEMAFYDCRSLVSVKVSSGLVEVGEETFWNCYSLKEIKLPATLTKMGAYVFENCHNLRSVNIPEGITIIPEGTFEGCSKLETVDWHEGIVEIQANAFRDCDTITEAGFPEGIREIAENLFADCDNLQAVYIPQGVEKIGNSAFEGCESLAYVFVPDTVLKIGKNAFRDCKSLKRIDLPKNISFHDDAFDTDITTVQEKKFTDETTDKIDKEFENLAIEKIYVIYDKEQGEDVIYSPENNGSITISHSERLSEKLADNMALLEIDTPTEFLEYLKKARDAEIDKVLMGFDSKVAAEVAGEPYFVTYNFAIEDLIQNYEQDSSQF